ncbi:MAG: transglycosylase domain-containing protein, partial [Deltaproteobacteria bacterium]|nr:transglycosylase domain-containing protein [Deltaproteobacteria bacterium]
ALAVFGWDYPVHQLRDAGYGSLVIEDRNGVVLRRVSVNGADGFAPRHRMVSLEEIDSHVISTLLASEDNNFFDHPGVDIRAIFRAMALNIKEGGVHYGASTITMQLMRNIHSAGKPRTLWNKLREMVLALRLERAAGKQFILAQYLNRVYFGHQAYGIEAAARRYFGKSAGALSVGEATYLSVIPRGPSVYDPLKHHRRVLERQKHLLGLLVEQGRLDKGAAQRVLKQKVTPSLHAFSFKAPHFVDWVLQMLPDTVRKRGGVVNTTRDYWVQAAVEHSVADHVARLRHRGVEQAGVVILDSQTGQVIAMVGAAGYSDAGGSEVNIVTRRRYPGSSLKPFVYATAIENGDSPATLAEDMMTPDSAYQVAGRPPKSHGLVRYREALAGSYNIAAVHVLEKTGVAAVMEKLRLAGVSALTQSTEEYGLRLALGDTRVRLLDLAAGYGFLVREGKVVSPVGIERVDLYLKQSPFVPRQRETRVFSKEVAWLTMDMLSDTEARRKVFGQELPADLPYKVAVKTGTARGFSDTVAVFATSEYTVAAWTGRFDGNPTKGVLGMSGAGPLARDGLLIASKGRMLTLPPKPAGIVTAPVCPVSGKRVSDACPHQRQEYFLKGMAPTQTCHHDVEKQHIMASMQ